MIDHDKKEGKKGNRLDHLTSTFETDISGLDVRKQKQSQSRGASWH